MKDTVSVPVPTTGSEIHMWKPSYPDFYSRSEVMRQTGHYSSALPALLAETSFTFDSSLLSEIEEATLRLQEFDYFARSMLGKHSLTLGPMSAILLRTESASSSQIENLTTTAKQLALVELGMSHKPNAEIVMGNVKAMEAALRFSDSLDVPSILAMHEELLINQPGLERYAGKFRDEVVWVGGRDNAGPRNAEFVGPQPPLIVPAMDDLVRFMRRSDIPSLAHIALSHAQFETIHPFVDGNGRTGRAISQMMLRNKKLTIHTTVPISAGILINTRDYFGALTTFRQGDAAPIIQIFCDATRYACGSGKKLITDLHDQLLQSREQLTGIRADAQVWNIIPHLIAQPIVNSRYLKKTLGINDAAAARALDTLVSRGILEEKTGHSRNRMWVHHGILSVLDEYASQIQRHKV